MKLQRRHLVTLFSLLLWAQLIFSVGLLAWRYWGIFSGQFEIFVSTSPTQTVPLIELSRDRCDEESSVYYIGSSETDYFYVRYELFPQPVVGLHGDWPADLSIEAVKKKLLPIRKNDQYTGCIIVDRVQTTLPPLGKRFDLNSSQYLIVVGN
jgi:hypothetical protein